MHLFCQGLVLTIPVSPVFIHNVRHMCFHKGTFPESSAFPFLECHVTLFSIGSVLSQQRHALNTSALLSCLRQWPFYLDSSYAILSEYATVIDPIYLYNSCNTNYPPTIIPAISMIGQLSDSTPWAPVVSTWDFPPLYFTERKTKAEREGNCPRSLSSWWTQKRRAEVCPSNCGR